MRHRALILFLLLSMAAVAENLQTATLKVQNMTCAACEITIRKALEKVNGVKKVSVDYESKTATVSFDAEKTNPTVLTKATTEAGFPSTVGKQ